MKLSDRLKKIGCTELQAIPNTSTPGITFWKNNKRYRLMKWMIRKKPVYKLIKGRANREFSTEDAVIEHFAKKQAFNDDSIMPFGPRWGMPLCEVPDGYLLSLYRYRRMGRLEAYILDNLDALQENVKNQKMQLR